MWIPRRCRWRTTGTAIAPLFSWGSTGSGKAAPSCYDFKTVLQTLPDARLLILGSEPGIARRFPQIEVIGRVPSADVRRWLVKASVFCLPTRLEPFGIAPIEAFVHRLPWLPPISARCLTW